VNPLFQVTDPEEEKWRSVINIKLKIKDKIYTEVYNLSMAINLNLALYLVKYLKWKGQVAEKEAHYGVFALYKEKLKDIVHSSDYVCEGDVL